MAREPEKAEFSSAVAVKGDAGAGDPRIVAKGKGALAERILDIAFDKGVKVRQDKELVAILDNFDVESPVPLEALEAVTRILQYVYLENQAMRQAGTADDAPGIEA